MKEQLDCENTFNAYKKGFVKAVPFWVLVLSVILTVAVTASTVLAVFKLSPIGKIASKLGAVDKLANENYVGDIDYTELDEKVLSGYVEGLDDRYSFYENKEGAEAVNNSFIGNTTGIGVSVFYDADNSCFQVFRINSGSPAESAGITVGDKIVSVDGKTIKELGGENGLNALKKEVGKTSVCGILRGTESLEITVTHKEFVKQSVYFRMVEQYGYICFTDFNDATVKQFENSLNYLTQNNAKGIIFDLRDNGGGTVDSVCEILDELVGKCDIITVKYKDGGKNVLHRSDENEVNVPMIVLTNENTASAAELFAATIRDMNKGKLIGGTTYGKGVMQRTYNLSDGSCVRFTVAEFFPAGGESFNEIGLYPDFEVEFTEKEQENKFILGDSDPYIVKALEVLSGEEN